LRPEEPGRRTPSGDVAGVADLVRNAIALRLAAALAIHVLVEETFFAPDQGAYHHVGAALARYWAGESFLPPHMPANHPTGYFHVVAAIYTLLGPYSLLPKLLNAALGGLSVLLVHDLALRLVDDAAVARRAALYAAYFPSLVLWSALNIRDGWVIALILLICRQALVLQARFSLGGLVVAVAALWSVTQFRTYIFLPVAGPLLVSFLVRTRGNLARNVTIGMLLALAVVYIDQSAGTERRLRTIDFEEIQYLRHWNTVGANSRFEAVDISTPGRALVFLPVGLAYFLFAPFPWMLTSLRQVVAMPETLFFYSLVPAMVRGVRVLIRQRLADSLMVLLVSAGLTFGYALGEGNAGTAYRHRAQMLSFYLIFAAVGIEARRREHALAGAPDRLLIHPAAGRS
jgi:hypothetical protein